MSTHVFAVPKLPVPSVLSRQDGAVGSVIATITLSLKVPPFATLVTIPGPLVVAIVLSATNARSEMTTRIPPTALVPACSIQLSTMCVRCDRS